MINEKTALYLEFHEVFYEELTKIVLNCFQSHFSDFNLEINENAAIFLIKKLDEFNSKSANSFMILEKLVHSINEMHKLFSAFFLEYMIHRSFLINLFEITAF